MLAFKRFAVWRRRRGGLMSDIKIGVNPDLLSPESDYISGQTIVCSGGFDF
jgi:hypothetical protein